MTIAAALELLIQLLTRSAEISALIDKARREGRETLTPEEWANVVAIDDEARARLAALIAEARQAEPPATG